MLAGPKKKIQPLFEGFPKLPSGLHYEVHSFDPQALHVVWPGNGACSIHLKRRAIAPGWSIPHPRPRNEELPSGKGWKKEMVDRAIKILENAAPGLQRNNKEEAAEEIIPPGPSA